MYSQICVVLSSEFEFEMSGAHWTRSNATTRVALLQKRSISDAIKNIKMKSKRTFFSLKLHVLVAQMWIEIQI